MDRPEDGGLELEAMGFFGDSGSGALIEREGQLHVAGVYSNTEGAYWGSSSFYARVGDYHAEWIEANLESLDRRVRFENCRRPGSEEDDIIDDEGDEDEGPDDEGERPDDEVDRIDCLCGCDPEDLFCWGECFSCLEPYFDDDEGEDSSEGINCGLECECDYEDMYCWE